MANIQFIIELWVDDMDFAWIDPDNGSILFVELCDLPSVPSRRNDIIVKLIPECQRCELRARERSDGTQVQAVDGSIQSVTSNNDGK